MIKHNEFIIKSSKFQWWHNAHHQYYIMPLGNNYGKGIRSRENCSDKQKVFNPEDRKELVCGTNRRFALGEVG